MPQARSTQKSASGAPGVKILITAASLAASLGGWAVFNYGEAGAVGAVSSQPAQQQSVVELNLPPLPTLVPPPAQSVLTAGSQPNELAAAPAALPALRVVSAPPPVTMTRSSR